MRCSLTVPLILPAGNDYIWGTGKVAMRCEGKQSFSKTISVIHSLLGLHTCEYIHAMLYMIGPIFIYRSYINTHVYITDIGKKRSKILIS